MLAGAAVLALGEVDLQATTSSARALAQVASAKGRSGETVRLCMGTVLKAYEVVMLVALNDPTARGRREGYERV
jgi:hypothetical protein